MAGGAFFDIVITGKGATARGRRRASIRWWSPRTSTAALQSMVARNVPPTDTAVLSVTRIAAGDAYNVIPQTATLLAGTARAFRRETMGLIEAPMRRLADRRRGRVRRHGGAGFPASFAPLVNDAAEAEAMADAAAVAGRARRRSIATTRPAWGRRISAS